MTCSTGTCFIQKTHATSSSPLQGKPLPLSSSPQYFWLICDPSLTQLHRYTPETLLPSTATPKYIHRVPVRKTGQEQWENVAHQKFQSMKRIQPLPVCAGFFTPFGILSKEEEGAYTLWMKQVPVLVAHHRRVRMWYIRHAKHIRPNLVFTILFWCSVAVKIWYEK